MDDSLKLDQVNLVVRDMDAMVGFYRRLGFTVQDLPAEWAPHHRGVEGGEGIDFDLDSRAFAKVWNAGLPDDTRVVLTFRTADRDAVDRWYTELTSAGYAGQQEPYDASWGARFAVVGDPDGNPIGFMSPIDPERRWPMGLPSSVDVSRK